MASKPALVGLTPDEIQALGELQAELLQELPNTSEHFCAQIVSRLLDVPVHVASAGFQFGADGGTAGLKGRRLRVECKRYEERTWTNARSLAGQVEQAGNFDPALEAWVLLTTKTVSETDRNTLNTAGEARGIPVIVVDWSARTTKLPGLAALCAGNPDIVKAFYGDKAEGAAVRLSRTAPADVQSLRDDLQPWAIGFKELRSRSLERLQDLWGKANEALALLNQNAAGGASGVLVHRKGPTDALDNWFLSSEPCRPAAVCGPEGHGKTWAALDWLIERQDAMPIVLPIPSHAMSVAGGVDEDAFLNHIARFLRGVAQSGPLELQYWRRRVDRLLARPQTEDPAFLLVFDGLNQNPTFPWANIARIAQGETCRRGVRIVFTVRTSYLEKQREFQPLIWGVTKIPVGQYTSGPGKELEQALAVHGLDPATLHRSLLERAAVPRILPLIARLKGSLALQSEATVHRILWEYALDEYKHRADPSFTNEEFAQWIVSQADDWREARAAGRRPGQMSQGQLLGSLDASSRPVDDVDRKLSDLVDGLWVTAEGGLTRKFQPSRDALSLGLAISLLEQLKSSDADTPEALRDELRHWLEPIVAFDETTEVVRTALSILSKGVVDPKEGMVASALMGAWLYAQNPTPDFEADVLALGSQMPASILDAMEEPTRLAHTHAFDLGAQALRRVPLGNAEDWARIEDRLEFWSARLVCPRPDAVEKDEDGDAAYDAKRLRDRIGTAEPGRRTVLGVPVQIDYAFDTNALRAVPAVLEGHRLDRFKRVFVAAAVAMAVRSSHFHLAWTGIRALTSFALEPTPTLRDALRQWSAELAAWPVEEGVNPILAARAAALLLWAAGEEADDLKAIELNPRLERHIEYLTDYEADPASSMFALEQRHFELQLVAEGIALTRRLGRAKKFIADPQLAIPPSALVELEEAATSFDIGRMDLSSQRTGEDLAFGDLAPGLARFAPSALATLIGRRLDRISKADAQTKYWGALRAREFLLLATPTMADAIGKCRGGYTVDDAREERVANTWLLQVEIAHLTAGEQLKRVSEVDALLTTDLIDVLRPGGEEMVRSLLSAAERNEHTLCLALGYMAEAGRAADANLIDLMVQCLASANERVRATAVIALHANAPDRLFQALHDAGWSANPKEHFEAHYGSLAYANHGKHLPFEDVAADIAPWCLLEVARCRGGAKAEFEQAIEIIDRILERSPPQAELVGDVELVNEGEHRPTRMRFNQAKREEPFSWSEPRRSAKEANEQQRTFEKRMSQRIKELRAQGAHLLLQDVKREGVAAAWAVCSGVMRRWLDGVDDRSREFVVRLHSADGLYFALCEVLLKEEPALGAKLWRALRRFLPGRFAGPGGVSALVLMVFKVPPCAEVEMVRMELLDPSHCRSDLDLLDLVVAARMESAGSWLAGVAKSEAVAGPQWRRKRAILLLGMLEEPAVDAMKWPAGQPRSDWAKLRDEALIWANRGALARHWWHLYLVAPDAEKAYAAFTVFLSCADRRALSWMQQDTSAVLGQSDLDHLKWSHWWLNRDMIRRAMKKREEDAPKLADTLCAQDCPSRWLAMDGLTFV